MTFGAKLNRLILVLSVGILAFPSTGHAVLMSSGDIAFVGVAARIDNVNPGNDRFNWVTFVDIGVGEMIFFTDDEQPTFVDSEGALKWTATSPVAAGTVVQIDFDSGANTGTASTGTVTEVDPGFSVSTINDSLAAYLGPDANTPTTFLTAFNFANSGDSDFFDVDAAGIGLTDGLNAIDFDGTLFVDMEVYDYTGPTSFASTAAARSALNSTANWVAADGTGAAAALLPFNVGPGADAFTFSITPPPTGIPEPGTLFLFTIGLTILILIRGRSPMPRQRAVT